MNRIETPAPLVPEVRTLDPARLGRLRRVGYLLDSSIPVPGTRFRFGIDSLIGLVPGIGDLVGGALSVYIILESARLGVPRSVLARMGWNVAIDTLVGEVPILGDLFDAGFKANVRNLALLDGVAREPLEARRSNRLFVALLGTGLLLLTVGAITLTVLLVRLASDHLQSGLFQ
ncbi:MAG: DUF4112 domain-containing protein [Gemmatimonadales bacterium]|nr:DUF4112 domain-containing protein [Gemmatimonadales bacterium]